MWLKFCKKCLDVRYYMVRFFSSSWYRLRRRRLRYFIYHNLLHADDPPHKLALGMAVGIFVALTPTVGVQMVIAGFLSWLLRANKAVSVAVVWISNPGTMVPIYWYCYRIGCAVLRVEPIGHPWWSGLTAPPNGWWPAIHFYWSRLVEVAGPLWLGSFIAGGILAYFTYCAVYRVIRSYRLGTADA